MTDLIRPMHVNSAIVTLEEMLRRKNALDKEPSSVAHAPSGQIVHRITMDALGYYFEKLDVAPGIQEDVGLFSTLRFILPIDALWTKSSLDRVPASSAIFYQILYLLYTLRDDPISGALSKLMLREICELSKKNGLLGTRITYGTTVCTITHVRHDDVPQHNVARLPWSSVVPWTKEYGEIVLPSKREPYIKQQRDFTLVDAFLEKLFGAHYEHLESVLAYVNAENPKYYSGHGLLVPTVGKNQQKLETIVRFHDGRFQLFGKAEGTESLMVRRCGVFLAGVSDD